MGMKSRDVRIMLQLQGAAVYHSRRAVVADASKRAWGWARLYRS